ncbi:MAG: hypothetical protein IKH44_10750 [Bacteroidales bacterium]|nr:hypothetical protein [Bacteroidales bacterium]
MKLSTLQFGKAMSAALFVLLLVAGMKNALAQNLVATLQHEGTITGTYFGQNALVSAYNAASDGDIITLSSGVFVGTSIYKAVTIHGAGCVDDTITGVGRTQVSSFGVSKSGYSEASNSIFEGIYFSTTINFYAYGSPITNVTFRKCNIDAITYSTNGSTYNNIQFENCVIKSFSFQRFLDASFVNSVVKFSNYNHGDIYKCTSFHNSVALFNDGLNINNLIAYNSIFATISNHTVSNCTFFNCLNIKKGETSLFDGQTCNTVMEVNDYSDVFETFNGTVSYDNIYQLKNDIATSFLGHDGTEVGLYGGMLPYRTRPHYMIIRNCNVAGRTTIDNKLSVEIELIDEDE